MLLVATEPVKFVRAFITGPRFASPFRRILSSESMKATSLRQTIHSNGDDVRLQIKKDGKQSVPVSSVEFLLTTGILVPFWATVMLPLTLTYQIVKGVTNKIITPEEFLPISPFDSGYQVEDNDIIPRSERKYDIVIVGATGFAGKLAVRHLAKTYGVNKQVKWAVAGRSKSRLDEMKASLAQELGLEQLLDVDCIIVDTSVPSTLPNLVRNTKVVVTTAGPFWNYGSALVEFCSKFGTHYADITGETSWVKSMMLRWHQTARRTGAKIVSLTGHDSIPWDLSVSILAQQLKHQTGEDLVEVTCFDEAKSQPSGGTLDTIMLMLGGKSPPGPTSDPFRFTLDGKTHINPVEGNIKLYPSKVILPWDQRTTYGSPFFMSGVNLEVVSWSQALRGDAPLKYSEIQLHPDFKTAAVSYFQLLLFLTGILNPITKYLLKNFVLPKPGEGPSLEDMENNSFLSVTTHGIGSKGSTAEAIMYFPRDAGYLDTARMLVESGLCMALQEDQLPAQGGGFFPPGYCLGNILLQRLTKTGTYFQCQVQPDSAR